MKKILFTVAVFAAITVAGCSTATEQEKKAEKTLQDKIENCTNPDSMKVYVEQAKAYAAKLVAEGKPDEAKKYLEDLTPAIDKAEPSLKQQWGDAVEAVKTVTVSAADSVADKTAEAVDSVKAKSSDVKAAVVNKAEEAKGETKNVVDKVVDGTKNVAGKVKDGTVNTYEKVKDGTVDTYNKAKEGTENFIEKLKK